jgi:hypothetical protein
MSDKTDHSPLPWRLEKRPRARIPLLIEDANGDLVADCEGADAITGDECEANARLVVRAVNAHVALLAWAEYSLASLQQDLRDAGPNTAKAKRIGGEIERACAVVVLAKARD